VAYQLLKELLRPHLILFLWAGVAIWRYHRAAPESRRSVWRLALPWLGLLLLSTSASSYLAMGTLEWKYPPLSEPSDFEAIVVLGGYLRPVDWEQKQYELGEDTLYRCLKAADLYHLRGKPCPIIVTGGKVDPHGPSCAELMADLLGKMRVPSADLVLEARSQSTHENAVETSKLLHESNMTKIVLITDAGHLPRAVACFKKQGVTSVIPCGCRYRTARGPSSFRDFLPSVWGARGVQEAWHEWLGIVWYWWNGRI